MRNIDRAIEDLKKGLNVGGIGANWVRIDDSSLVGVNELVEKQYGLIHPTVSSIVEDFAGIELALYFGDEKQNVEKAMMSLNRVNNGWTRWDLLLGYGTYMSLLGEVYWYMPLANDKLAVRDIYLLNPLNVTQKRYDRFGNLVSFDYKINNKGKVEHYVVGEDVIVAKSFNAFDMRKGFAKLENVRSSTGASESAFDYNRRFFDNDATPSLLIKIKRKMNEMQKSIFKANWLSQFQGKEKAHKFALADDDMSVERLSMSNKDMEFKTLLQKADERVLATWRVNKVILGQTEGINRATIEGAEYIHAKRVVDPMCKSFVSFLNEKYLRMFYDEAEIIAKQIHFEYVSSIPQNIELNSNIASRGVAGRPFMSINEARKMIGLDAIDDGKYDEIPEQYVIEPVKGVGDSQSNKETLKLERKLMLLSEQNKALKSVLRGSKEAQEKKKQLIDAWKKEWIERAFRIEPTIEKDLNKYFKGLGERMKEVVGSKSINKAVKYYGELDASFERKEFVSALEHGLSMGMIEAWERADEKVVGTISFDMVATPMEMYLQEVMTGSSIHAYDTTEADFKMILEQASMEGWSVDRLAEEIDKLIESYYANRSKTIAVTELNAVVSGVTSKRYERAKDDGVLDEYEWIATLDDKTRPAHMEASGQVVHVGGEFNVGGERMKYPADPKASVGNRVNCRCAIMPVVQ